MSEPTNKNTQHEQTAEIERQRQQLADDLGYLLARYWLEQADAKSQRQSPATKAGRETEP